MFLKLKIFTFFLLCSSHLAFASSASVECKTVIVEEAQPKSDYTLPVMVSLTVFALGSTGMLLAMPFYHVGPMAYPGTLALLFPFIMTGSYVFESYYLDSHFPIIGSIMMAGISTSLAGVMYIVSQILMPLPVFGMPPWMALLMPTPPPPDSYQ